MMSDVPVPEMCTEEQMQDRVKLTHLWKEVQRYKISIAPGIMTKRHPETAPNSWVRASWCASHVFVQRSLLCVRTSRVGVWVIEQAT